MQLDLGSMPSRVASRISRPGGVRQLLTGFGSQLATPTGSSGGGGFLGWVWGIVKNVGGWLISNLWKWLSSFISWSFTAIVQWIQNTFQFIWTFDWNQTDAELDAIVNSNYQALLTQAAGTLGASLGWLVGGLGPGTLMFVFNQPLAVFLLKNGLEEMVEELLPQIGALIQSTARAATRHILIATYKRLRQKIIGANEFKSLDDAQINQKYAALVASGSMTEAQAKEAIERGKRIRDSAKSGFERKPWSFQKKFEEFRETYIPKNLQNAAEEFSEEFSDSFFEGLYVNANSLDEWVTKQRLSRPALLGTQAGVRITFNRNAASTPPPTPTPTPTPTPP